LLFIDPDHGGVLQLAVRAEVVRTTGALPLRFDPPPQ
jgi:hypothetical protein